jgi:hypothetical protein
MHACAMYSAAQDERAPHWNTKNGTAKPQMHFQNWKILRARQPPLLPRETQDARHRVHRLDDVRLEHVRLQDARQAGQARVEQRDADEDREPAHVVLEREPEQQEAREQHRQQRDLCRRSAAVLR